MNAKELRAKTEVELNETLKELREEAFNLRWQRVSAEFKENHKFKIIRRSIARILTIVKEKTYNTSSEK